MSHAVEISSTLFAQLGAVTAPIAAAAGLPNDCYVRDDLFVAERDHVLGRNWAALTFASDLPEPGWMQPIDWMGLPLLVVRDKADVYRVFHNVCSHRGMILVREAGPVPATIRCPYHSWSYAPDGELKGTPHLGGVGCHRHADFNQAANGLKEVRSARWHDLIFVNLSADAIDFEEFIAPLNERWASFLGPEGLAPYQPAADTVASIDVACNWKLAAENYLESYHLPWVHPELNKNSPLSEHYTVTPSTYLNGQGSTCYQLEGGAQALPTLAAWPSEQAQVGEYPVLYPNTLFGLHADHFFVMILMPHSVAKTQERLRLYFLDGAQQAAEHQARRQELLTSWQEVFREDVFAVEGMQQGRASPGYGGGAFSPVMDGPTHHFHCWVAQCLRALPQSDAAGQGL